MTDKYTCGYRRVQGMDRDDSPMKMSGQNLDEYRLEGGGCSYCGSVSQAAFLEFVEAGGEVGPTDKDYKVYLNGDNAPGGKFYFYHLDDDGKRRFIELYNDKRMKIGYPGHFYARPYFCISERPAS